MDLLTYLISTILLTIPLVSIFHRAGLNPVFGFLGVVPVLGPLIALAVLALKEWPNEPAGYR